MMICLNVRSPQALPARAKKAPPPVLTDVIDSDQAETLSVAQHPFEIVEERPVKIAANVGAAIDGAWRTIRIE
jgi:hypothetical protein